MGEQRIATVVISDVTLHGVSLGTSICTTQTISSNGVAPVITSISYTSTGGLKSGSSSFGSHTVTEVTRPDSDGIATRTTIHPDATRTVETLTHGLTTRVENQDASDDHNVISHVDYDYDVHQRLETVTDSRTGEAGRTTYDDFTESGDPLTTKQGSAPNIRITSVAKDILGRTIQTTLPDDSVTHTSYWPTGQVKARWGSQTNPVFHIYDEQNRLKELHTWQTAPALEQATVEPPDFSAKTQWIYGSTTGRLDRKQYADGKGTDYTYTAAGRIETRIWARAISVSNPTKVTTTYGYTHGFITSTVYNDGTPNLEYTYDNLGRQNTVKRGGVLHADYDYRSDTLALDKEMLQIDTLNKTLIRTYEDGTGGTLVGRPNGYTFTGGSATWGYDDAGRLSTVTDGTNTFTYGYRYVVSGALHEGSTAENSIRSAMPFTLSGPQVTTTLAYEATRHVLASRQNNLPGGTLSKFTYTVNPIGQRETVTTAGTAFGQNPANWIWGYDSLGQVISANSPTATSDRGYLYDSIGNRRGIRIGDVGVPTEPDGSIQANQGTLTYASNPLNQYSTVPQATAAPVFDFDGNMTSGPVPGAAGQTPGIHAPAGAQLTWDAENRLVKAVVAGTIINYAYDHLSRLISRSEGANPTTTTHYLYDGWNRIAQYQSNGTGHTLEKTYLWGMDLSGTMQGAGGVGGLLAEKQGANTYYPTYDGNGNVSEYVTGNGAKAAHFEYDPFGNLTMDSENNAATFPYRFSTKPQDPTTGLYFYTYRWYDPLTGRWPTRDPIDERGGINLYGFVLNVGVSWIDYLGLFNQNAQQKCDFVIAGRHADDNWKRIDLGEDEEIGRLRCVGCHANRQNEVTGTTSQNGWQNNWLVRPEDYKLLKDDQDNRLYSDEDIENIRKDRKHRKVSDNDLLADEDTHKALKKELDSEANIAEKDGCRCCKKVTIKVECAQDFAVVELKILGSRSSKAICGTTWELDCKSKKWTKK